MTNIIEANKIPNYPISVFPQTPTQEFERVAYYIRNKPWYDKNGYKIILPIHPAFTILTISGSNLSVLDTDALRNTFYNEVYDIDAYQARLDAVTTSLPEIKEAFNIFRDYSKLWGFKLFDESKVLLTQYGTSGSFDAETGSVLTRVDSKLSPLHVCIHEFSHVGIAHLVQEYKLTHWEEERVVDLICYIKFRHLLPNYMIQTPGMPEALSSGSGLTQIQGDDQVDNYVNQTTLNDLPLALSNYVNDFPR